MAHLLLTCAGLVDPLLETGQKLANTGYCWLGVEVLSADEDELSDESLVRKVFGTCKMCHNKSTVDMKITFHHI